MSRPRLCLHCKKPIAPHRGRPSDFCKPAHKLAWKAAQRLARPRRGRKAGRAVVARLAGTSTVGRRDLRMMKTSLKKLEHRLDKFPPPPRANAKAPTLVVVAHEHPTLATMAALSRIEARLQVLENRPAAAGPRPRQFEASLESTTLGPVTHRHLPPAQVRQ